MTSAWWLSKLTRRADATRLVLREADWLLLLQVTLFAAAVPLLMRVPIPRLQRLLEPARPPGGAAPDAVALIVRHVELARRIGSPMVRPGCLTRGVTRYYFLRRIGLDVSLCFGMGQVVGQLTGHCWLTREGTPFLEGTDPRPVYAHIISMPMDTAHPSSAARGRL